jgi:predicted metalloprotease with PDZ domain
MTIDAALPAGRSLIGASNSRANGNDTILYARGMLIAFLGDLKMLVRSGGKRDFSELLRSIFDRYKDPTNETDGNAAVLSAIGGDDIKRNVETGAPIDWATALRPIGIEKVDQLGSSFLRATSNPSSSQKKLLDKLGYNNWRKTSVRPK